MFIYTILLSLISLLISFSFSRDLVITDITVSNFPDHDNWPAGVSDPYLRIHLCSEVNKESKARVCDWNTLKFSSQTSTIDNTLNPKWYGLNTVIPNVDGSDYLFVEYFDEDGGFGGDNDYVASMSMPIMFSFNLNTCGSDNKQQLTNTNPYTGSPHMTTTYHYYFTC